MKKKVRVIGNLSALAVSVALLAGGVFAASQVSLDVTSNISFEAEGVYIKVNGQIQAGASEGSLSNLEEVEGSDYTYIGYSYDAVTEQTETGTSATTYDDTPVGTASNDALPGWAIGEISFSENNVVVRHNFTFTNYSEFVVNASITNYSAADGITPALTGIFDSFGDSVAVEESVTGGIIQVPARSETAPGTANYTITFTLNKFTSGLTQDLAINFRFESGVYKTNANYSYFEIDDSYTITGLTQEFLDNPTETLIIPGKTQDGLHELTIGKGTGSNIYTTFLSLPSVTKHIVIEDGAKTIGSGAFAECEYIETVTMVSVETIGYMAFFNCASLKTVDAPKLKVIESSGFAYSGVETINFSVIEEINSNAFESCNLEVVDLPETIESIGHAAFDFSKLTTLIVRAQDPPGITDYLTGINVYVPEESIPLYEDANYWESVTTFYPITDLM